METQNITQQQSTIKASGKSRRGFASMDKDRHKLVSSKGGKSERTNQLTKNLSAGSTTSRYEGL